MLRRRARVLSTPLLGLLGLALGATACGSERAATGEAPDAAPTGSAGSVESRDPAPRLAITYDGGVMVVDVATEKVLLEESLPGYLRVSAAGDGRHVLVAAPGGWQALDLGSWGHDHGDHAHHYTGDPRLTDVRIDAEEPGHVVTHGGHTTVFDDGTGVATSFDAHDLETGELDAETYSTGAAHHGVAVRMPDRNLVHTVGTEDSRSGVRLVSPAGIELAATDACPGVHGEAFAADAAVLGCEDGAVVVSGREIRKASSPDDYGRIGNQAGSEVSPVLLGDYKVDADAELERPTRVSLVDTRKARVRLVDLGTSYSFRSLARGPSGEALVLGTDGAVHEIDPTSGRRLRSIEVVAPWREPLDWQRARPTLHVVGATAYVTEPARDAVHVLDLGSGRTTGTIELPHTPDEIVANAG